jgi:hypothetical protein
VLTPLKERRYLDQFIVYDIETTAWPDALIKPTADELRKWHNKKIVPFVVSMFDGKDDYIFEGDDCCEKFLDFILSHAYRSLPIFAHNAGKFDVLPLLHILLSPRYCKKYSVEPRLQQSRIFYVTVHDRKTHKNWKFCDSFSLINKSLKEIGKSFRTEHQKTEMPPEMYHDDPEKWKAYCTNDCHVLYEALKIFSDTIKGVEGNVGYTMASTAMRTFRTSYLHHEIENSFPYNELFRKGYYGGRTEIFNMYAHETDGPYYDYDVNSMYPSVMRDNLYPISRPRRATFTSKDDIEEKVGIAHCRVRSPDINIPLLPYHQPLTRKLLFPIGSWEGFYDFSFIVKARELGYTMDIIRAWEFTAAPIFQDYVDTIYMMRCRDKDKGAVDATMKLMLNSLYGKFGENPWHETLILDPESILGLAEIMDTGYYSTKEHHLASHQIPQIALRVTSLAQLRLYEYIEKIKEQGGTLFYCDTDSLMTDVRLPTSDKLGDIKLEYDFRAGIFLRPKMYFVDAFDKDVMEKLKNRAAKGFSKEFQRRFTFDDFENALLSGDCSAIEEQKVAVAPFKMGMRRHFDGFVTYVLEKNIKTMYDKRRVMSDFSTKPLVID